MIRLFKSHAKFLLLMLIMWKHLRTTEGQQTNNELIRSISDWINANPDHPAATWASSFDWQSAIDDAEVDEQIDTLVEGLSADPLNAKGDMSIIATIIEVLGLPWTGNRLGQEAIPALRKAILRPSEIANFQKIVKESFQCIGCGHKFVGNEAAVMQRGSNNEIRISCIRCVLPSYGACSSCGDVAAFTSTGLATFTATKFVNCGCALPSKAKKESARTADATFRTQAVANATNSRGGAVQSIPPAPPPPGRPTSRFASRLNVRPADQILATGNILFQTTTDQAGEFASFLNTARTLGLDGIDDDGDAE